MPFCTQCGNPVTGHDQFCWRCGGRQPATTAPPIHQDPLAGVSPRTASVLSYVPGIGWIACIIWLASDRFRQHRAVRFHAFQGLYLFVAWLLVDWVVSPVLRMTGYGFWQPLPRGGGVLHLLILAGWIVMIVKVTQGQHYRLPILGDLAERSVAEQRAG